MTYRDEPPMPSCPMCGGNEQVSRDTFGQKNHRGAYLCGLCWSVFSGGQDEWNRSHEAREAFQRRQENKAVAD